MLAHQSNASQAAVPPVLPAQVVLARAPLPVQLSVPSFFSLGPFACSSGTVVTSVSAKLSPFPAR